VCGPLDPSTDGLETVAGMGVSRWLEPLQC
jgi:hypothetical protein